MAFMLSLVKLFQVKMMARNEKIYATVKYDAFLGKEVIKKIEHQPTNEKSRPYNPCTIANCGELVLVKKVKKLTAEDLTSSSGMFIGYCYHFIMCISRFLIFITILWF